MSLIVNTDIFMPLPLSGGGITFVFVVEELLLRTTPYLKNDQFNFCCI